MADQSELYRTRRAILAKALRTECVRAKFNWGTYCHDPSGEELNGYADRLMDRECGTVACVAGWCPAIFPEDWTSKYGYPSLAVESPDYDITQQFAEYFGLSYEEARWITLDFDLNEEEIFLQIGGNRYLTPEIPARRLESLNK